MPGFFITGTDTGVGKTWVTVALLRCLAAAGVRAVGMKPVASGAVWDGARWVNDDGLQLQAASAGGANLPYEWINPYVFEPPIAPHIAAARAGVAIRITHVLSEFGRLASGADVMLVEGVGGWLTPLGPTTAVADLARALALPVILVVGLRLGCLNHALLTAAAIRESGCRLAGWIANNVEQEFMATDENLALLRARLAAPQWGVLAWQASSPPGSAARVELALDIGSIIHFAACENASVKLD